MIMVSAVLTALFPVPGGASPLTDEWTTFLSSLSPSAGQFLLTAPGGFFEFCEKWCAILGGNAPDEGDARHIVSALRIAAGLVLFLLLWTWILIRYARRRRKQLKTLNERYRLLLENTLEGVMVIVAGKATFMNERASQITGFSPHEITPRALSEITGSQDSDTIKEAHRRIMRSEIGSLRLPVRITCKNGETKWVYNCWVGITWKGTPGILCIFSDITESKKMEQQFLQAQKMEAIGQLAGGIAHDFNNILTAISGYGNLLRIKTDNDPALNRYARNILACSNRAANLVKGLLAFSRKQVNDPRPTDLHDVIKGAEKMLRRIIGEHIEFSVIFSKTSPVVLADSNQIIQVLINLATNARDAMPKGGKVTIRTETVENPDTSAAGENGERKDGRYALLSFEDTGEGMDESMIDKIFDPFFTTKEPGKASGLGLATIYGIVKQQKGFISVQTNIGSGTTFNIYLPLVDIPVDTRKAIRLAEHLRGTETILVCEDETDIRNFVREVLESNGYTVVEAKDGEEGIDAFNRYKDKVALVLLDVMMPKKSGKDVYDAILEINPMVKTIFMTGYSTDSLDKQGFGDSITPCIFKPIETDTLLTEIRRKLDEEKTVAGHTSQVTGKD
ncbi:MAG: response regulator [Syntrophorhabdus sp.]|nr:response regulator [Syntrophorhabdus sp.]